VVECGGLENRCTARYRGFESLFLRHHRKTRAARGCTGLLFPENVKSDPRELL